MQNHLKNQTSPYLLQHADNPVEWYPWGEEAFERAKREDKPIFLSIGYSTCHWCHVMAHESFEDDRVAKILNRYFVSIKVDKEERPDLDSIYMSVCQAFTGGGGWPTTIFLTPEQKPFFAGTYFPKTAKYGQMGLIELLMEVQEKWQTDRKRLLQSAEEMIAFLDGKAQQWEPVAKGDVRKEDLNAELMDEAFAIYKRTFDNEYGGFGRAPKFPTPHNLLFLMRYYERYKVDDAMKMVDKTLLQMYRGGIFDHIGGGFSRYSTDPYFLVPHFEKMLYDNALLILAYCKAYQMTKNPVYLKVAKKTGNYILREMTSEEGGFFSAQDADSEGVEGKYYLFEPREIIGILGEKTGQAFLRYFDMTEDGNFEGKNIPNLLGNKVMDERFEQCMPSVYEYRKRRYTLHLDDKILTAWNGLMIAAMCHLYRITGEEIYLNTAVKAQEFIENNLCTKNTLYVSYRKGRLGGRGFLDDYANEAFALLALYEATLNSSYLERAEGFCKKAISDFYDREKEGFFLYGKENEQLILRPKETYDGAMPSGNAMMAYNLVQLFHLTGEEWFGEIAKRQLNFLSVEAKDYPAAHAMFLVALWDYMELPDKITIVVKDDQNLEKLPCRIPLNTVLKVIKGPSKEYPLMNDQTTFYICEGRSCKPPVNELPKLL